MEGGDLFRLALAPAPAPAPADTSAVLHLLRRQGQAAEAAESEPAGGEQEAPSASSFELITWPAPPAVPSSQASSLVCVSEELPLPAPIPSEAGAAGASAEAQFQTVPACRPEGLPVLCGEARVQVAVGIRVRQ